MLLPGQISSEPMLYGSLDVSGVPAYCLGIWLILVISNCFTA